MNIEIGIPENDRKEMSHSLARLFADTSERVHDQASLDLLTQRLQVHEKTAWMLRAMVA